MFSPKRFSKNIITSNTTQVHYTTESMLKLSITYIKLHEGRFMLSIHNILSNRMNLTYAVLKKVVVANHKCKLPRKICRLY